jgi:hypothetical protein
MIGTGMRARTTARTAFALHRSLSANAERSFETSIHAPRVAPQTYNSINDVPGERKKMNLFTAINDAMHQALENDPKALVFGEDVGFGGVFR